MVLDKENDFKKPAPARMGPGLGKELLTTGRQTGSLFSKKCVFEVFVG